MGGGEEVTRCLCIVASGWIEMKVRERPHLYLRAFVRLFGVLEEWSEKFLFIVSTSGILGAEKLV